MKKVFGALAFLFFLSLAGLILVVKIYAPVWIKDYIEKDLSKKTWTQIHVENVGVSLFPDLGVELQGLQVQDAKSFLKVQMDTAQIKLRLLSSLHQLHPSFFVFLGEPHVFLSLSPEETPQRPVPPTKSQGPSPFSLPNLSAQIEIQKGALEVSRWNLTKTDSTNLLQLENIFLGIKIPSLLEHWKLNMSTQAKGFGLQLPVEVDSLFKLNTSSMTLQIENAKARLAGLWGQLQGSYNLQNQEQDWSFNIQIPDMKEAKEFAIPGQWTGSIVLQMRAQKKEKWLAAGRMALKNLDAKNIQYNNTELALAGDLHTEAQLEFEWNKILKIKRTLGSFDLSQLHIKYKNLFNKPKGTTLEGEFQGETQNDSIKIQKLRFQLAQLKSSLQGSYSLSAGGMSEANLVIQKTNLDGFEKLLPLIPQPMKGSIQTNAKVRGNLNEVKNLHIELTPLILEKVQFDPQWVSENKSLTLKGPVNIDAKASLILKGSHIEKANIQSFINLGPTQIIKKDMFQKAPGAPLSLQILALQQGQSISIKKLETRSPAGLIRVMGTVTDPLSPRLNLQMQTSKLNLTELSKMLPLLRSYKLNGQLDSQLKLTGHYDPLWGIEKSPLALTGSTHFYLPHFQWKSAPSRQQDTPILQGETTAPQPLLPPWPILENLDLQLGAKIQTLDYEDIQLKSLDFKGRIYHGLLNAKMDIGKVFGATLTFEKLRIPLNQALPRTDVSFVWGHLNTQAAFNWAFPQWKDLLSGESSGNMELSLRHPKDKDFLRSEAQGELKIKNGFIKTLKFDDMVNEKLSKIPGVGNSKKVSTKGVAADIYSQFSFKDSMLRLKALDSVTPEKNEMKLRGWVRANKSMDLVGTVWLTNAPVGGSFHAANSDSQGRLSVPVRFQGDVTNPSLEIAQQTIQQMLSKTATYEAEKLKAKAKNEIQKALEEKKKSLQEDLTKGLKNILGK